MSTEQQALKLATETLSELFQDIPNTASVLRRCLTISTMLHKEDERWIREELEGYHQKCTFEELKKFAPNYRFVKVIFKDRMGRVVIFPHQLSKIVHDDFVSQSIGEVEDSLENGLTVLGGELLDLVKDVARKNFIADIAVEYIDSLALKKIVEQVRNKALDFLNRIIKEQNLQMVATVKQPDITASEKVNEFTYEAPNADSFLEGLVVTLNAKGYPKLANLLSDSKSAIIDTKQWARYHGGTIWNANATTINIEVQKSKYLQALGLTEEEKGTIMKFGNEVINPNKTGLEITELTFSILLRDTKALSSEPYKSKTVQYDATTEFASSLLYTLENALRFFVGTKLAQNNGLLDENIKKDWESSRRKEALPPRKPLDCHIIYYSSFDQLKKIIVQNENWEKIFKPYFGRPNGVISRLNELDDIRDTLAHNRVISEFDFNSFKALYDQIMGCIEKSS